MEQRINLDYLQPSLMARSAAFSLKAFSLGGAILVGTYGVSLIWKYTPPEIQVRVKDPILTLDARPLKLENTELQLKTDPLVVTGKVEASGTVSAIPAGSFKLEPAELHVAVDMPKQFPVPPPQPNSDVKVVTDFAIFKYVTAPDGVPVTTGWHYATADQASPDTQWCYTETPNRDGSSKKTPFSIMPTNSRQYCQWFNGVLPTKPG